MQVDQIVCKFSNHQICGHTTLYKLICAVLVAPLCMLKHMKHLAYVSALMLVAMFFTFGVILYETGAVVFSDQAHWEDIEMFNFINYPFFFGISLLNFEGNPTCLNVRSSMQDPDGPAPLCGLSMCNHLNNCLTNKWDRFTFAYNFSAVIVTLFGVAVGSFGLIAYGPDVSDIILLSLPASSLATLTRTLYCLCLMGTFPIQMYMPIYIVESSGWYQRLPNTKNCDLRYYIGRLMLVLFSVTLAIIIPKVGLFINFNGAFCGTILCVIAPVMIYSKTFKDTLTPLQTSLNYLLLLIGILFGGTSAIASFISLLSAILNP
ncbi:unnamed protein product [Moneuplotes crassus]|uniref:Amino acid transporter transmembrane domain-containing protein n=1 Tax=Euplotes crassus TaxID=5936 RepID=A0AAD2CZF4_EUPCR|nr:unnamed protein product [Moneuplotes crassus]